MGRQIEFIHTEEDIASFLLEIERKGGHIIHNQVACSALLYVNCLSRPIVILIMTL